MSDTPSKPAKVGWVEALNARYWRAPSVIFLIVANLVPLYGVLFWGWDLFVLILAYWIETGIIGFFTAIRMVLVARWAGVAMLPFFIVHFGIFMGVHVVFLWTMFAGPWMRVADDMESLGRKLLFGTGLWIAVIALSLSHGASFFFNVLRPLRVARSGPDYKPPAANEIMVTPYGRVVIMHLTILLGAFLVQLFRTPIAAFVLLVALKLVTDLAAHVRTNFSEIKAVTT